MKHDPDEQQDEQQIQHQHQGRAGEELADLGHLLDPGDDLAGLAGLEIADGQADQMAIELAGELGIDLVGQVTEHLAAQKAVERLGAGQCHHGQGQHVQTAEAAPHQHLVDDVLEQQRTGEGDELQQDGETEDVPQLFLLAQHRRAEPAQPEFDLGRGEILLGQQQKLPLRRLGLARQWLQPAAAAGGIKQLPALWRDGGDGVPATIPLEQGRQRQRRERAARPLRQGAAQAKMGSGFPHRQVGRCQIATQGVGQLFCIGRQHQLVRRVGEGCEGAIGDGGGLVHGGLAGRQRVCHCHRSRSASA